MRFFAGCRMTKTQEMQNDSISNLKNYFETFSLSTTSTSYLQTPLTSL